MSMNVFPGAQSAVQGNDFELIPTVTRRPASADRTARRQFQATGQPVSRTQASDAMTSRLPRYEAKYVQRRCFQCGSVPLHSDMKGTERFDTIPACDRQTDRRTELP